MTKKEVSKGCTLWEWLKIFKKQQKEKVRKLITIIFCKFKNCYSWSQNGCAFWAISNCEEFYQLESAMEIGKKSKTRAANQQGDVWQVRPQKVIYLYTYPCDHCINPTRIIHNHKEGSWQLAFHCIYCKSSLNVINRFYDFKQNYV